MLPLVSEAKTNEDLWMISSEVLSELSRRDGVEYIVITTESEND